MPETTLTPEQKSIRKTFEDCAKWNHFVALTLNHAAERYRKALAQASPEFQQRAAVMFERDLVNLEPLLESADELKASIALVRDCLRAGARTI